MTSFFKSIWRAMVAKIQKGIASPENGCGKCGVCHHVCSLLDNKSGAREE